MKQITVKQLRQLANKSKLRKTVIELIIDLAPEYKSRINDLFTDVLNRGCSLGMFFMEKKEHFKFFTEHDEEIFEMALKRKMKTYGLLHFITTSIELNYGSVETASDFYEMMNWFAIEETCRDFAKELQLI